MNEVAINEYKRKYYDIEVKYNNESSRPNNSLRKIKSDKMLWVQEALGQYTKLH